MVKHLPLRAEEVSSILTLDRELRKSRTREIEGALDDYERVL